MTSLTPGADVPHLGNGISRPGGSRGLNRSRGRAYRTHSGREYSRCANGGCDEMAAIEGISVQIVRHRVPVMLRPRSVRPRNSLRELAHQEECLGPHVSAGYLQYREDTGCDLPPVRTQQRP